MAVTQIIPGRVITSDPLRGVTGGEQSRDLTVNPTMVSGTETNFPALINLTANNLRTTGNGGLVTSASGHDIRFYASDGTTLLNWEMVSYDGTAGTILAWARIPSMTTSTAIKMKYGNAAITTFQGGAAGSAWNSGFSTVWHMGNTLTAAGQTIASSATASAPLTAFGTWSGAQSIAGKVGLATQFLNANGNYFTFGDQVLSGAYSIEGWFNPAVADVSVLMMGQLSADHNFNLFNGGSGSKLNFYNAGTGSNVNSSTTTIVANTWYRFMVTRNGTTAKLYLNGVLESTTAVGVGFTWNRFGRSNATTTSNVKKQLWRISTTDRSADYDFGQYNTVASPSTFWSLSAAL